MIDATQRVIMGAHAIAAYFGKRRPWLYRQLARGKRPPPVFRIGSALAADPADLDLWIQKQKQKGSIQ